MLDEAAAILDLLSVNLEPVWPSCQPPLVGGGKLTCLMPKLSFFPSGFVRLLLATSEPLRSGSGKNLELLIKDEHDITNNVPHEVGNFIGIRTIAHESVLSGSTRCPDRRVVRIDTLEVSGKRIPTSTCWVPSGWISFAEERPCPSLTRFRNVAKIEALSIRTLRRDVRVETASEAKFQPNRVVRGGVGH